MKEKFIKEALGKRPIYLTGLMGVGKTTIGVELAKRLGVKFFDLDNVIVKRVEESYRAFRGLSVEDEPVTRIFQQESEEWFRERERNAVHALCNKKKKTRVIALGGGAFDQDKTRKLILDTGVSIFLSAPLPLLVQRVGDGKGRPLLTADPEKTPTDVLGALLMKRRGNYAKADITVELQDEILDKSVERVVDGLYNHLQP